MINAHLTLQRSCGEKKLQTYDEKMLLLLLCTLDSALILIYFNIFNFCYNRGKKNIIMKLSELCQFIYVFIYFFQF